MFYAAGHTGVVFNYATHEQKLLQGHVNRITSICVSPDRRWLVTADAGDEDAMIIVWDADSCTPVRTIFDPHGGKGVAAMDLSHDAKFIISVGTSTPIVSELIAGSVAAGSRGVGMGDGIGDAALCHCRGHAGTPDVCEI